MFSLENVDQRHFSPTHAVTIFFLYRDFFLLQKYKNLMFSLKNLQPIHVYDVGWIIIRFADI